MKRKLSAENCNTNRLVIQGLLAGQDQTASDLARHLKISPQYMSELLHGRRNITPYVARIAAYLGVSPRKIVSKSQHTPTSQAA